MESYPMKVIAHIRSAFPTKFGIPRQSGLVPELRATVIFEPEYRSVDALRGLDGYSHLWLIWCFSGAVRDTWSPTVRPPRLGGNTRMGVFATRSPFRPNPIGLSSVKLEQIALHTPDGPVLIVSGADLMDGTPIFDIKPYLPYVDCHTEASGGFTDQTQRYALQVICPSELLCPLPEVMQHGLLGVLANDPRPSYQDEPERIYGMSFSGYEVKFSVSEGVLTVCSILPEA